MIDGSDLLGLASATAAAACFDGAVVFQALEAREIEVDQGMRLSMLGRLVRRPRWLLASGLAILGWPFQLLALSLAPLTLVQPTLSLGLVLLLVMGSRMLHEPIGRREAIAVTAIVSGVVGITLSAPKNSDAYDGDLKLVAVLVALAVVMAIPYVVGRGSSRTSGLLVASAGAAIAASGLASKLITDDLAVHNWGAAVGWAAVAGAGALVGLLSEMSAVQRRAVGRVAPPIFVISTVVPVMLAPWLTGESWSDTPLNGAVIVVSLVAVAIGGAALGGSRAVGTLVAAGEAQPPPAADSTTDAAVGRSAGSR